MNANDQVTSSRRAIVGDCVLEKGSALMVPGESITFIATFDFNEAAEDAHSSKLIQDRRNEPTVKASDLFRRLGL